MNRIRADLHVHSKHSKRPSEWILRKIGCAESYTEPLELYKIARTRGMDLVTITDHNTLAGSLEIAHLKDTFISEEITTYFPEDKCKLHVLAYVITESQHEEISRLRENVFDLISFLRSENIRHGLAHPFFSINDKLTIGHLEQLFVLFNIFELNGSRDSFQNDVLTAIVTHLNRQIIEGLCDKYDIESSGKTPWRKVLISGSDDHSALNIASRYTEVEEADCVEDFFIKISQGCNTTGGISSSPRAMGQNLYSIAFQFYNSRFNLKRYCNSEPLLQFMDRVLMLSNRPGSSIRQKMASSSRMFFRRDGSKDPKKTKEMVIREARDIVLNDSQLKTLLKSDSISLSEAQEGWFRFVNRTSEKTLRSFADSILEYLKDFDLFDIFSLIGAAGSLYTILSPYFIAFTLFTKDRKFCRECKHHFLGERSNGKNAEVRLAHFTDTFYEFNGVARTLRIHVEMARKNKKYQKLITCEDQTDQEGIVNFPPIGSFQIPEYPEISLKYPPLLRMLDYCYEQEFTHIHTATPGPVGLAALAIARILQLPIYSTYHTALPQYANSLTDDSGMEDIMWKYCAWYYNQVDIVYVPSHSVREELISKGINEQKIRFYQRGIDTVMYHPDKRNGFFERFGIEEGKKRLLYVGRISKEKSLDILFDAYRIIAGARDDVHLIIVGEGPYMEQLKQRLDMKRVTFTGYLQGEDLAQAYASSDLFVFPSNTDTFGNVVLEAQSSGLPAIVTDKGGPKENIINEKTGLIVHSENKDEFINAINRFLDSPELLHEMKINARSFMEERSFENAYLKLWETYNM